MKKAQEFFRELYRLHKPLAALTQNLSYSAMFLAAIAVLDVKVTSLPWYIKGAASIGVLLLVLIVGISSAYEFHRKVREDSGFWLTGTLMLILIGYILIVLALFAIYVATFLA